MSYKKSNPNGQAAMANSEPVVIASDQSAIPVSDGGSSLTVDGAVSATGNVAAGASDSGNPIKVGGVYKSSPGTVTNGQRTDLLTDEYGQLKVVPLGTVASNVTQLNSTTIDTNSGNKSAGTQRVVIATDQPQLTNSLKTEGTLTTNSAAPSTNNVGALTVLANATTPTVTEGNITLMSSDLSGRLRVQGTGATGSAVPGIASFVGGQNGSGNLEGVRTAASTTNTTTGVLATATMAVFDDTSPTAITENQFGSVRMSANRNLYQTIRDAAGNERGANVNSSNQLSVSADSVTPGTAASNLGKAEDAAHASGDVGVMDLGVRNDTMADFTGADNDYTPKSVTQKGHTLTANAPRGRKIFQATTITSSTTETTVLTAAASTYHDVYGVIVSNTSATATDVTFKDATAGTTRFNIYVPAGDTRGFMLPIDAAHNQASVNNNWTATCGTSVASIKITMMAVKNL